MPCGKDAASSFTWLPAYGRSTDHLTKPWLEPIRQEWLRLLESMPATARLPFRGLLLAMEISVGLRAQAAPYAEQNWRLPHWRGLAVLEAELAALRVTGCDVGGQSRGDAGIGQSARPADGRMREWREQILRFNSDQRQAVS